MLTGEKVVLSPENLVDCQTEAMGCKGAKNLGQASEYMKKYGVHTEECYPYVANSQTFKQACKTTCEPDTDDYV